MEGKVRKILKSEKGSISGVVLVTILFFIIVLSTTYAINVVLRQSQLKSAIGIKETYEKDIGNINEIYSELTIKVNKVEVGKIAEHNGTINGNKESYKNPIIPEGYIAINTDTAKWDAESGPEYNNGLVITDNEINGNEWVWVPIDSNTLSGMYETANPAIAITGGSGKTYIAGVSTSKYSKSGIISGRHGIRVLPNDTNNTPSYREPDIIVGNDGTTYDAVEANRTTARFTKTVNGTVTTMTVSEMAKTMVDEYNEMIESIEKYGGFYIGRYELSSVGVKKDQPTLTNSTWYALYKKCKELAKNETVNTRMIWGCQWDVTCNWIANNGDKRDITDSSSWGNYKNAISPANIGNYESGVKKNTGSNEAWKANNIYDFAGNCIEWTQEANSATVRAYRGGFYNDSGSNKPAIDHDNNFPTGNYSYIRFSSRFNGKATIIYCL